MYYSKKKKKKTITRNRKKKKKKNPLLLKIKVSIEKLYKIENKLEREYTNRREWIERRK